jgi:sphingosine kinase
MASMAGTDDPFRDPLLDSTPSQPPMNANPSLNVPDTLAVGRNASLTLGTDSLIVLDEALLESKSAGCCGLSLAGKNKSTRSIPFYNILWAEHSEDGQVTIQYAQTLSKKAVRPAIVSYALDKPDSRLTEAWIEKLLSRAYGPSQRRKRIKVLVNPFGGQGGAVKTYHKQIAPILAAARCDLDVEKTTHNGHGVEIAQSLDIEVRCRRVLLGRRHPARSVERAGQARRRCTRTAQDGRRAAPLWLWQRHEPQFQRHR